MTKTFACISYSRKDVEIAKDIWLKLEKYVYPHKYVSEENRPYDKRHIRRVFFDMADLSTQTRNFSDEIKQHLRESRYLILIWSENSAKSEFVRKEIDYFLETHGDNTDKIVAVYVDKIFSGSHPRIDHIEAHRNCPIYYTASGVAGDVGRRYCFYHILEFLLKVDFNILYNRYERYKRRKRNEKIGVISVMILTIMFALGHGWYSSQNEAKAERDKAEVAKELAVFESKTFPYSLVVGYVNNFMKPMLDVITEDSATINPHVLVLMPYSYEELTDSVRVQKYSRYIKENFPLDTITKEVIRPKVRRREISIIKLSFSGCETPVYSDIANTVVAFKYVVDYKLGTKNSPLQIADNQENRDSMVRAYTDEFILRSFDSIPQYKENIHYIRSVDELSSVLNKIVVR